MTWVIASKFTPPTDAWDGEYILDPAHYSITDTYDFNKINSTRLGYVDTYKYETQAKLTKYQRFKCNFWVDRLPPDTSYQACSIVNLGAYNTDAIAPGDDPAYGWALDIWLSIMPDGSLTFSPSNGPYSTNKISAGTTYALEVWMPCTATNHTWQIYVDGVLWLSDSTQYRSYTLNNTYLRLFAGFLASWGGPTAANSLTLHVDNIIWTQEDLVANGRWTMNVLL